MTAQPTLGPETLEKLAEELRGALAGGPDA